MTLTLPQDPAVHAGKRDPISLSLSLSLSLAADMPNLSIFFVFLLLSISKTVAQSGEEKNFFRDCPVSRCSNDGPEVKYPLRLNSSSKLCGVTGLELSCSGDQTILTLHSAAFTVTAIDYSKGWITTRYLTPRHTCPLGNLSIKSKPMFPGTGNNTFFSGTGFTVSPSEIILFNCSERLVQNYNLAGPISCLGGADGFVYAADMAVSVENIPSDCMAIATRFAIPVQSYTGVVDAFSEGIFTWRWRFNSCFECEGKGRNCWFNRLMGNPACSSVRHGLSAIFIAGTSIGGLFVLIIVSVAFTLFCVSRRFNKAKEEHLKVEKFLALYKSKNPTRFSFSDIKKITKRFSHKLGQGGFGSVYKGELPNGILVAVKTLERSRGAGKGFTNEVATIGRIHHANIVRLLGFCSEETSYALVYEFMPNESLEKFIFSEAAVSNYTPLSMEILQKIALGVANGIEYLHQGCNQRILHFDIKPHNILLDHDFNPKISDFGLAKLCSKDCSIVTRTAARGTKGYMAPEIYSRNFGTVSYKSDVYSFGMLVMEMVGSRRNIDLTTGNQGEIYFPEWVYNRLINAQDLVLAVNMNMHEEEIAKKLAIVALWCIQWSPVDRPSMTKVVEMLIGDLQSLQLPPKPFFSSSDQDYNTS